MPTSRLATGKPLRKYSVMDFSGGVDKKTSPNLLATLPKFKNRLTDSTDCAYPHSSGVSKREDIVAYNTTTLGASVRIIGGYQFRHSNGTDYNLAATNDGRVVRLNTDGTTTTITSGLSVATQATMRQFGDLLLYTDRVNAPQSWDGTTWQALAGTPPTTGGPVAVHSNRAFMLDATNQRRISWSKLGDAENWTAASDAGSVIVTGRLSSPLVFLLEMTSELLLGHRDYVTRLQGTAPSTYAITNAIPAQVSIGGASIHGAVFGNNDGWWISQRGIHNLSTTLNFGDYEERFASTNIDPYFVPNTGLTISLSGLASADAAYDQQNNRLYFSVDTNDDGQNDTVFVRDIATNGWSVWSVTSNAIWTAVTGSNGIEVFFGGYDGFVRKLTAGGTTNAISGSFSHISNLGLPFWQKNPRHIYVYLEEAGAGNLTVTQAFDFGTTGGQVYSVSMLSTSALLGTTFTLGTSVLGGRDQIVKRLDTTGLGEFMELTFSNAQAGQPFTVYGYEVLFRERRQVARAS